MENRDDTGLEEPQELDTNSLFPEPPPIPTIDLSSLMQVEYTPEIIEQLRIPEIPPPPSILTIDLSSLMQVEYTPEIIEQLQIPEIPPPPPIVAVDLDSLSPPVAGQAPSVAGQAPAPEATSGAATESPPPAAGSRIAAPAPAAEIDEQADGQALWEQVLSRKELKRPPRALREQAPARREFKRPLAEPIPLPPSPRRKTSWVKTVIVIFVLTVILPMLCCCAVNYVGE
jgi:hypothetical protein